MPISKFPTGSASAADGRPRAQIAYEGEDEFSTFSLDPDRANFQKQVEALQPGAPGQRREVKIDPLKPTNESGLRGLFRRIFAK